MSSEPLYVHPVTGRKISIEQLYQLPLEMQEQAVHDWFSNNFENNEYTMPPLDDRDFDSLRGYNLVDVAEEIASEFYKLSPVVMQRIVEKLEADPQGWTRRRTVDDHLLDEKPTSAAMAKLQEEVLRKLDDFETQLADFRKTQCQSSLIGHNNPPGLIAECDYPSILISEGEILVPRVRLAVLSTPESPELIRKLNKQLASIVNDIVKWAGKHAADGLGKALIVAPIIAAGIKVCDALYEWAKHFM